MSARDYEVIAFVAARQLKGLGRVINDGPGDSRAAARCMARGVCSFLNQFAEEAVRHNPRFNSNTFFIMSGLTSDGSLIF